MGLFERIIGTDPDVQSGAVKGIASHLMAAGMFEWQDGAATRADLIASFGLRAEDEPDLDWMKTKFVGATNKREFAERFHHVLMLAESRHLGYDTKANFVARINALAV